MIRRSVLACAVALAAAPAWAYGQEANAFDRIPWVNGPATGQLGDVAQVEVPEGCLYTGADGTRQFLELTENPTNGQEQGTIFCALESGGEYTGEWFVIFEYDPSGYVKDDEKDELDAGAILAVLREANESGNREREKRGWSRFEITGWETPPHYDEATNNLTWAIRGESPEGVSVNHSVRLLGRGGVMSADLVVSPEHYGEALPAFNTLLGDFGYNPGQRYSEWRAGDKVAAYGLTALVAGGAGAIAAKTGLLAKFWKVIVAGIAGVSMWVKKLFSRIVKRDEATA